MKNSSVREFELAPYRELSDGTIARVYPYHLCFEGKEDAVLFRDDEDCDVMVKYIALSAHKCATFLVHYVVVSNHVHIILLAAEENSAIKLANDLKKRYSMWMNKKYSTKKILCRLEYNILLLDSIWYLRNAIAYVTRNALDNSDAVDSYRWCAHQAFFISTQNKRTTKVADISTRDVRKIFHCRDFSGKKTWAIDNTSRLEPSSVCDVSYVESAFNKNPVYYMKVVGVVNIAEMKMKLEELPRGMRYDADLYQLVSEISMKWYNLEIDRLSLLQKSRLLPYVYRTIRTSVPQLARVLGLEREKVSELLHIKKV